MDASEPLLEAARPQVERSGCQLGDYGAARQQLLVVAGDGGAEASDGAEQLVDGFLLHGGRIPGGGSPFFAACGWGLFLRCYSMRWRLIHSRCPRSVASEVQCSLTGVTSASFGHCRTL